MLSSYSRYLSGWARPWRFVLLVLFFLGGGIGTSLAEEPAKVPHQMVDLAQLPDPPLLDIRYATPFNFTGQKLYPLPGAWLHRDAAEALARVQARLREKGMGLRVFDAYRPLSVQQMMWDLVQDERYVSNPATQRGRHTRGTAVDVSLTDRMGNPLPMPSGYDDFTERAHRDYMGASEEAIRNRQLLEEVMVAEGFEAFPSEWWHFDFRGWQNYPVWDLSLAELAVGVTQGQPVPPLPQPSPASAPSTP